jgi:hypothetical protein
VLDHDLSQIKLVRFLMGGVWVKAGGSWRQVDILMFCRDGSRIFTQRLAGTSVSFHETNNTVQAIESWS